MSPKPKKISLIARTDDGSPVVEVFGMETHGDQLIMDCKALDSMRMDVVVSIEDVARGLGVVDKKAIIAFAKQLPAALRAHKKQAKQHAQETKKSSKTG